jgi:hypothetical protein
MSTIPIIIKTALNWQKEVALAEKAGIVPHPNSNWRWALRQIRAKNPTGARQSFDDLILKGRDLAKAKEKMGLLPNNVRQKMKAMNRKLRPGTEMAYTTAGKYVIGEIGSVPLKDGVILSAHTHPYFNRAQVAKNTHTRFPSINREWSRLKDGVLDASPSGVNWSALPDKKHINKYYRHKDAVLGPIIDKYEKIKADWYKNAPVDQFGLQGVFPMSLIKDHAKEMEKAWKKVPPKITRFTETSEDLLPHSYDFGYMLANRGVAPYHNIISKHTTGVHKIRPELPRNLRSVYFKGGLD